MFILFVSQTQITIVCSRFISRKGKMLRGNVVPVVKCCMLFEVFRDCLDL